ncbi:CDP-diacylglycerol--glycerol-3-phosphate 3-phosphatidyltransferase [Reinekea marina]|uniref:CDP-diacylglycerol--glycerol-3-phosphate 3-phosphatidyltransferase n=1 Tax=Reinekea marina TaxID=1310421 RepID=A0ABV7WTL5_9GAMM|nr:CDP-diacylglycerol--glycerol-3-phosphate 3-phosphatidyltransferase [Reinekea marina]MBU2865215.1 CDP-diacylglycerol--glycerol-3-phosphate 3-phosphatidyltransferase [Reinekea forsetii]MDN3649688.1 CDP-diacylglycerol--glycerol-3-phosphate 3-phosphatidyltransferase [Reinekea marina]
MNIPNLLTMFRVILIPVCVIVYYLPFQWAYLATAILFTIAAVTDWFDGYLARKLGQMTPFGAFLDPVADKLIVAAALVVLVESHASFFMTIPAVIIIGREIVISALREWMAEAGKRASVAVNMLGKLKTTMQMVSIIVLLAQSPDTVNFVSNFGLIALQVAAALTLWSMIVYLKAAWSDLKPQ